MLDRVPEIRLPLAEIIIDVNSGYLKPRSRAFQARDPLRHRQGLPE
jgi:hypothetical protein